MAIYYSIALIVTIVALATGDNVILAEDGVVYDAPLADPNTRQGTIFYDESICAGKVDQNIVHPEDCTKYISCSNERAIEMPCPACNHHLPNSCLRGKLVFNDTAGQPGRGQCLDADKTQCLVEGGSSSPKPPPPGNDTKEGDPCDPDLCKNVGRCQSYLRCDRITRKYVLEECGYELVWNPKGNATIHGGNCDLWENLDEETENEHRSDPECLACFWKAVGECHQEYDYQAPGLKHRNVQRLKCADGLVFSQEKETCQRCEDARRENGLPCC